MIQKPTNEITYDDIIQFCKKGIPENMVLDYKRNFPKDLAKIISAFANTWGGTIIIGVEEEGGVPSKYEGIKFDPQFEDRVTQSVVNSVTPIFLPEIKVCRNDDDKAFVFIRIHQSEISPHAINKNKKVYIRTGSTSKPFYDLADLDEIDFLKNRRQKSTQLLEYINDRSLAYYDELLGLHSDKEEKKLAEEKQGIRELKKTYGIPHYEPFNTGLFKYNSTLKDPDLQISIHPKYIHKNLINRRDILEALNNRKYAANNYRGVNSFPSFNYIRSVPSGIAASYNNDLFSYINEYGYITLIKDIFKNHNSEKEYMLLKIFFDIDNFLNHAIKFYDGIKYYGHIEMNFKLDMPSGYTLKGICDISKSQEEDIIESIYDTIYIDRVFTLNDLMHNEKQILTSILLELFWCLGFDNYNKDYIEQIFSANNREFN